MRKKKGGLHRMVNLELIQNDMPKFRMDKFLYCTDMILTYIEKSLSSLSISIGKKMERRREGRKRTVSLHPLGNGLTLKKLSGILWGLKK